MTKGPSVIEPIRLKPVKVITKVFTGEISSVLVLTKINMRDALTIMLVVNTIMQ